MMPAAQNIARLGHLVSMYPGNVLLEGFFCLLGRNVTWPLIYPSKASKLGSEAELQEGGIQTFAHHKLPQTKLETIKCQNLQLKSNLFLLVE